MSTLLDKGDVSATGTSTFFGRPAHPGASTTTAQIKVHRKHPNKKTNVTLSRQRPLLLLTGVPPKLRDDNIIRLVTMHWHCWSP
jgi:hypothetical protein